MKRLRHADDLCAAPHCRRPLRWRQTFACSKQCRAWLAAWS